MYKTLRKLLFLFPAETAHWLSIGFLQLICLPGFGRRLIARIYTVNRARRRKRLFNMDFRNPVGLGAGFDKDARYLNALEALGFGFVEIGTITPRPQNGNARPRLFRLPADEALINRMGFNNDGVEVITQRLKAWRKKEEKRLKKAALIPPMRIGGNIGKNKETPNEEAWKDYEICFRTLHPFVDFFVVNVSSPNTPGLRELQEKEALKKILVQLQEQNKQVAHPRPLLLKIAPDLERAQIDDVIALAVEIKLDGLVVANTTISREGLRTPDITVQSYGAGGLSGKPLRGKALELVKYIHEKTGGALPLIASGGIFTATDASAQWAAGASLAEIWTGFIYEGPSIVKKISASLD